MWLLVLLVGQQKLSRVIADRRAVERAVQQSAQAWSGAMCGGDGASVARDKAVQAAESRVVVTATEDAIPMIVDASEVKHALDMVGALGLTTRSVSTLNNLSIPLHRASVSAIQGDATGDRRLACAEVPRDTPLGSLRANALKFFKEHIEGYTKR